MLSGARVTTSIFAALRGPAGHRKLAHSFRRHCLQSRSEDGIGLLDMAMMPNCQTAEHKIAGSGV
jgi:hypothetical protein